MRKKTNMRPLNIVEIILALGCFFIITSTIANFIPWYSQVEPMKFFDEKKIFYPGQSQRIILDRNALIGFEGHITRELVRVHKNGAHEEVAKINLKTSVGKGKKKITINYELPTIEECPQMKPNTYFWQGSMVYRPFGWLEKTYFFETEKFQITKKSER